MLGRSQAVLAYQESLSRHGGHTSDPATAIDVHESSRDRHVTSFAACEGVQVLR